MSRARPWLPANAPRDNALSAGLASCAQTWAARWFAAPKPAAVRTQHSRHRTTLPSEAQSWSHPAGGFVVCMSPAAYAPLAHAMLGLETGAQKVSAQDQSVLKRLAGLCAADFAHGAAAFFGLAGPMEASAPREADGAFQFSISLGAASHVFELYVDEDLAIAARKTLLGAPAPAPALRASRAKAIASQRIRLGAMIGVGKLGFGELRTLTRGDVIVLDRGPDDTLALAVDGVAKPAWPCSIVQDGEALKLRLHSSQADGTA